MKHTIERPVNSFLKKSDLEKLVATIRAKKAQGLTLTQREQAFFDEQQRENWQDDNPRYGH